MEGSDTSSGQLAKQQLGLIWPRSQKLRALAACQAPLRVSAPRGSGRAGARGLLARLGQRWEGLGWAGACPLLALGALQGAQLDGCWSETCPPR